MEKEEIGNTWTDNESWSQGTKIQMKMVGETGFIIQEYKKFVRDVSNREKLKSLAIIINNRNKYVKHHSLSLLK